MTRTTDYTPTTEEIRSRAVDTDEMRAEVLESQEAEFDRWLTEHDTTTRVQILREAAHSGLFGPHDIATLERLAQLTQEGGD